MLVEVANEASGPSLQERFEAMRLRRTKAASRVAAAKNAAKTARPEAFKSQLRKRFVAAIESYVGTPYSAARNPEPPATRYLDCCGLVRQALLDLKEEFGFEVGPWNQAYLHDTLPREVPAAELQPGDLVFWTAEYDDPTRTPQKHDLVHVEVYVGARAADAGGAGNEVVGSGAAGADADGAAGGAGGEGDEATIGSRYEGDGLGGARPGVHRFASYRSFGGHGAHGHRLHFRSIETWLDGVCVSHCASCRWGEPAVDARSRIFAASAEDEPRCCDAAS